MMSNVDETTIFCSFSLKARSQRSKACQGQTLVEYSLILAIISVVAIGVLINMGQQVKGIYTTIDSVVASAQASH